MVDAGSRAGYSLDDNLMRRRLVVNEMRDANVAGELQEAKKAEEPIVVDPAVEV